MPRNDYALLNASTGEVTIITSLKDHAKGDTLVLNLPILNKELLERDAMTEEQIDDYIDAYPELEKTEFTVVVGEVECIN